MENENILETQTGELVKKKILFICTHNSARSQMAEGYMKAKYSDRFEVFSAGTEVTRGSPDGNCGDEGYGDRYLRAPVKTD
jgi:hypothetical protein